MLKLVILESPNKTKTVQAFLIGNDWVVKSSFGHVRDLPDTELGIDITGGFIPTYVPIWSLKTNKTRGAKLKKNIQELKALVKKSDTVYLCMDPDREGEAIAWHLVNILAIPVKKIKRATWTEEDKTSVLNAINNPRGLDLNLIEAQQTRRILDRIMGFPLSSHLRNTLPQYRTTPISAGRVQSAVLKMIGDREDEISKFVEEKLWGVKAFLKTPKGLELNATLVFLDENKKLKPMLFSTFEDAEKSRLMLDQDSYLVKKIQSEVQKKPPLAPFCGSTLMAEASRVLGFTEKQTMDLAQKLFEARMFQGELQGLITYHRTDSTNISQEALFEIREYIQSSTPELLSAQPNLFKTKVKNAQESHDAIRPKSIYKTPSKIIESLTQDEFVLYDLIWRRTVASQMTSLKIQKTEIIISNKDTLLRSRLSNVIQPGWTSVYTFSKKNTDNTLSEIKTIESELPTKNELLLERKTETQARPTRPPERLTSETLLKAAAGAGICRASSWPNIIELLKNRQYISLNNKYFTLTQKGFDVLNVLNKDFAEFIDIGFTGEIEKNIENITAGEIGRIDVLDVIWKKLEQRIEKNRRDVLLNTINSDDPPCPLCGDKMRRILNNKTQESNDNYFLGCLSYPKCRGTLNKDGSSSKIGDIVAKTDHKCPECGGVLLERKGVSKKTGKPFLFYGCEGWVRECKYTIDPKTTTNIPCPSCEKGLLVERVSKKTKKKFWPCSRGISKCTGVVWNNPKEQ